MRKCLSISAVAATIGLAATAMGGPGADPVEVTAHSIERFSVGLDQSVFGALEFLGGLDLIARDRRFSGLSGLELSGDGRTAYMVSDRGFLVRARLDYRDGRLVGLSDVAISEIFADGRHDKENTDAEDIVVFGDPPVGAVVSMERRREPLLRFSFDGVRLSHPRPIEIDKAARDLPRNAGLESVAAFPAASPYAGALLAIGEAPRRRADPYIDAWIVGVGSLRIVARDNFSITAARFLPGGDLLLLERRFTASDGIGMRLRRIAGPQIRPGATLDGAVLLEAGMLQQIDNMEGLAVHRDARGRTILTLVSDDNASILQRTLLLQFALNDR